MAGAARDRLRDEHLPTADLTRAAHDLLVTDAAAMQRDDVVGLHCALAAIGECDFQHAGGVVELHAGKPSVRRQRDAEAFLRAGLLFAHSDHGSETKLAMCWPVYNPDTFAFVRFSRNVNPSAFARLIPMTLKGASGSFGFAAASSYITWPVLS